MKGSQLKKIVKDSGVKLARILEVSGIKERTLYNLYEKEEVEQHYLQDLAKVLPNLPKSAIGVLPQETAKTTEDLTTIAHKLLNRLDKEFIMHDRHITDLEKNNTAHIEANKAFIKSNDAFVETSKILGRIVDMCLDAGAITVDRSKIVDVLSKIR